MAIGVRITSSNLNGKTATVTFVPAAGSPDGTGSVDLGTKTIPFNNIDTFPYGTYSLHFAEYDYTYELEIPVPKEGVQAFTTVAPMVGSTGNYGAGFLNFNDLTAEVIDLGVNANDWMISDSYPLHKGGYAYHFVGGGWNWGVRRVIFTNAVGEIIGDFQNLNSGWNYDDLDGQIVLVDNYSVGEVYYSDGVEVFTYNYDQNTYGFDFDWNNYAATKDKSMIFYLYNFNTHIKTAYNVLGNTVTEIEQWDNYYIGKYFNLTPSHDFYPCLTYDDDYGGYLDIKFRNTSGAQIGLTADLSDTYFNNYNWDTYGDNKFVAVFWNNGDINAPYRIIHFDGNTHNLIVTSHARGVEYSDVNIISDDTVWQNSYNPSSLVITFSQPTGWWNIGQQAAYYDLVYMLGNQTSFTTYTLVNDGTTYISYPLINGNRIDLFYINNYDGFTSLLTLVDGHQYNFSTGTGGDINSWVYRWACNELGLVAAFINSDASSGTLINSRVPNEINYTTQFSWPSSWWGNFQATNNIFFVNNDSSSSIYINKTSNGFQTLGVNFFYNYQSYYKPKSDGIENDLMLVYNPDTRQARAITGTTVSDEIVVPENNGWSFNVGKDNIMFAYNDANNNNAFTIKLYDRDFVQVNSAVTQYTNIEWNNWASEDRYIISFSNYNRVISYLVSPTTILNTIGNSSQYRTTINDYNYWND